MIKYRDFLPEFSFTWATRNKCGRRHRRRKKIEIVRKKERLIRARKRARERKQDTEEKRGHSVPKLYLYYAPLSELSSEIRNGCQRATTQGE